MSFSVDDLVSSLSSSHIGQEAIDLAALQAQLAETLFSLSPTSTRGRGPGRSSKGTRPCTTPRALSLSRSTSSANGTTPGSSGWGSMTMDSSADYDYGYGYSSASSSSRSRHNSISSTSQQQEMDEDERMVEELLLLPSSPAPSNSSYYDTSLSPSSPSSSSQSLFATQDPFYLAQLQAMQQQQMQAQQGQLGQSVFAQNARVAPTSPFALQGAGSYGQGSSTFGQFYGGHGAFGGVQSFAAAF